MTKPLKTQIENGLGRRRRSSSKKKAQFWCELSFCGGQHTSIYRLHFWTEFRTVTSWKSKKASQPSMYLLVNHLPKIRKPFNSAEFNRRKKKSIGQIDAWTTKHNTSNNTTKTRLPLTKTSPSWCHRQIQTGCHRVHLFRSNKETRVRRTSSTPHSEKRRRRRRQSARLLRRYSNHHVFDYDNGGSDYNRTRWFVAIAHLADYDCDHHVSRFSNVQKSVPPCNGGFERHPSHLLPSSHRRIYLRGARHRPLLRQFQSIPSLRK